MSRQDQICIHRVCRMLCCNTVNRLPITHNRHHIRRGMFAVSLASGVLTQSLQCFMQHHVILDCSIPVPDRIWSKLELDGYDYLSSIWVMWANVQILIWIKILINFLCILHRNVKWVQVELLHQILSVGFVHLRQANGARYEFNSLASYALVIKV